MKKYPNLKHTELIDTSTFLICCYHYDAQTGDKRRFVLPRLVLGSDVGSAVDHLRKSHDAFKWKLYFSNFHHLQQIFSEVLLATSDWNSRLDAFERRVPYLYVSMFTEDEMDILLGGNTAEQLPKSVLFKSRHSRVYDTASRHSATVIEEVQQ